MTGMQKTIAEAFLTLARWVEEGRYGVDDDIDAEAVHEDILEHVLDDLS